MSSDALSEDAEAATIVLRVSQSKRDPEGQLQNPTNISGGHHEMYYERVEAQKKDAEAMRQMAETTRRWDNLEKKLKGTAQMPKKPHPRLVANFQRLHGRVRLCWVGYGGKQDGIGILQVPQGSNKQQTDPLDQLNGVPSTFSLGFRRVMGIEFSGADRRCC